MLQNQSSMFTEIPQQYSTEDYAELKQFEEIVENGVMSLTIIQLITSYLLSASLKYLWN